MPELGGLLWQQQQLPNTLLISGKQYYWWLACKKHVRLLSVQAADKQAKTHMVMHTGTLQLAACERCTCNYHQPEPDASDNKKSFYAQTCWKWLDHVLDAHDVVQSMETINSAPLNMLTGAAMGYVLEAKVVTGWRGAADVYVPGLNLVLQVDGQHHALDTQQITDVKFMKIAHAQHVHVLRLWYADVCTMPQDIHAMVYDCMAHAGSGKPALARCSKSHPLCSDAWYQSLNV